MKIHSKTQTERLRTQFINKLFFNKTNPDSKLTSHSCDTFIDKQKEHTGDSHLLLLKITLVTFPVSVNEFGETRCMLFPVTMTVLVNPGIR